MLLDYPDSLASLEILGSLVYRLSLGILVYLDSLGLLGLLVYPSSLAYLCQLLLGLLDLLVTLGNLGLLDRLGLLGLLELLELQLLRNLGYPVCPPYLLETLDHLSLVLLDYLDRLACRPYPNHLGFLDFPGALALHQDPDSLARLGHPAYLEHLERLDLPHQLSLEPLALHLQP